MPRKHRAPPTWLALIQYYAVRFTAAALEAMPIPLARGTARAIARLVAAVDTKHRRIAVRNVACSYPGASDAACERFVRRVYDHLADMLVEILVARRRVRRGTVGRYLKGFGLEHFDRALAAGRGAILVIGHQGNWEFVGYAVMLMGYPMHAIARPLDNPYLDAYLNRFRTGTGQEIASKYNVLRQIGEMLNRNRIVIFLADQDARRHGVFVPFFGRPASTFKAPAVMAMRHGAPLLMADIYRTGFLRHEGIVYRIDVPAGRAGDETAHRVVADYTRTLEGFIRRHPEQYLWLHRRWKTRPPEEARDR